MQFFDEPLRAAKRPQHLRSIEYAPVARNVISIEQAFALPVGSEVMCDVEVFKNYFLVGFKHIATGSYFLLQEFGDYKMDRFLLHSIMLRFCIVTFNGLNFDLPIIRKAIKGASLEELKELANAIIQQGYRDDRAANSFNHFDLIEVAPLQASLKAYTARLHAQRIQELPVDPESEITFELACKIIDYNFNDLDCTELLRNALKEQIELRIQLSAQFGSDMRSKSDAQIAEAVISNEFLKLRGFRPKKVDEVPEECSYTPPSYMKFKTPLLQDTLAKIMQCTFRLGPQGYAIIPKDIDGLRLTIGKQVYRMSIGGLHSTETCVTVKADALMLIIDCDVASYYPKIILNSGIAPANMGDDFLAIYRTIVDRRVAAKKAKNMVEADSLKITTNGTFGKLGNPFSIMYSPELMLYVTLTGQLQLLLIIEAAALLEFEVISANTDGVVFKVPVDRQSEFNAMLKQWELDTNFEFEQTRYVCYAARDVNNYIAVKENGEIKSKGAYTERGSALNSVLSKNPFALIVTDAVKELLAKGTKIEETILNCRDVRRFVAVQNVRGGAHKDGLYLGRVVRWYYVKGEAGAIHYVTSGNQVPRSTGARPLMELPTIVANQYTEYLSADQSAQESCFQDPAKSSNLALPPDLDFAWYINEAYSILTDIGYRGSKQITFFG